MTNLILKDREEFSKNNYVRKSKKINDYWVDFSYNKLQEYYIKHFGNNFNLIITGEESEERDFYIIPFLYVKHIFTEENFSHDQDQDKKRWVATIKYNQFKVTNCKFSLDVGKFYGNPELLRMTSSDLEMLDEKQNDYIMEARKIEINAREKQSIFRRMVLENFQNKCCISEISEPDFLEASHIVPWSHNSNIGLDPGNGLCLLSLYHQFFDKGLISFDNDLNVLITTKLEGKSDELKKLLASLENKKASTPTKHKINANYLKYHRENIFQKHKN